MGSQCLVCCYRLKPAESTIGANKTKRMKSRSGRSADRPTPTPHEVNKYTYEDAPDDGKGGLNLSTNQPSPDGTDMPVTAGSMTPEDDEKKENMHFFADVFMERSFIITSLKHFEDYNIKVSDMFPLQQ